MVVLVVCLLMVCDHGKTLRVTTLSDPACRIGPIAAISVAFFGHARCCQRHLIRDILHPFFTPTPACNTLG
jgi:hypothetical protein